jgi:hypothetical protein
LTLEMKVGRGREGRGKKAGKGRRKYREERK